MNLIDTDERALIEDYARRLDNIHISISSYRDRHLVQSLILDESNPTEEMLKIYHLVEAHCPIFRESAINLFEKASHNPSHNIFPMDSEHLKFPCSTEAQIELSIEDILNKMEMMPPEWTLVQLTNMSYCTMGMEKIIPTELQITVFECGQNAIKPLTVNVESAVDVWGNQINIIETFNEIIQEINSGYIKLKEKQPRMKETYSEFKSRISYQLKQNLKLVQEKWLGEWRILLSGRFSNEECEAEIESSVKNLLEEYNKTDISTKNLQILKHLLRAQGFIDDKQSKKILEYCFPEIDTAAVINLIKSIKKFAAFEKQPRNPIILIVDESIDQVPWEMLDVLSDQPVSRMQSFHFTYALYNAHEQEIEDGRKIIRMDEMRGGMVMNPSSNLPAMENRLRAFQQYWMKGWQTMIGKKPTEKEFLDYVKTCNVFMYCGHGDGTQFIRYHSLEKLRINAVVLLFGCKSVALQQKTLDVEPWGTNQYYIMCCCPSIIGNIYNVTDLECDMLSTSFLSYWVPGPANKAHWLDLDLKTWGRGAETNISTLKSSAATRKSKHIPDLLIALNKAKRSAKCCFITQASCIARGIPVKLV